MYRHLETTSRRVQLELTGSLRNTPRSMARLAYRNGFKRVLDVSLVVLAAPFVFPVLALLALLIRLDDGGPAFFGQNRLGRGGREFRCWKLRTMNPNAEQMLVTHLQEDPAARDEWDVYQKLSMDPRITRMGGWLRATSLDELPQLWNVLCGDMSLVGPRPMLPEQQVLYLGLAYFRLRPGLTGPWQISARNDSAFVRRASWDRYYNSHLSLGFDVLILLGTVRVVLGRKGI